MSHTNSTEEESDQGDPVTEEFECYFPAAKSLALDLSTPGDTSIAAAWVQKLEAEQPQSEEEKRTRLNYLKLLLFVLQRGRLSGMFRKQPPSGPLQPFPPGLSILDMGEMLLEQGDTPACGEGDARRIPYSIDLSNDLREFVASQEIPNFGVQMYYAWSSDEPIHKWLSFDEEKFPQFVLDKIKQLKEIKSDEKATVKDSCRTIQKDCELPVVEKCSKKKVKSPQEIERAQGRNFHAYMGLVGGMGFNDKCGDDPDKSQRRDQGKGNNCPRNNVSKQCPGSGGEAEEILVEDGRQNSYAEGFNTINRPCFCFLPGHPLNPFLQGRRGPQPFPDNCSTPMPSEAYDFSLYGDLGTGQPTRRRHNAEPCPENPPAQTAQTQGKSSSPRPKSSSSNRPNANCSSQGNEEPVCNKTGLCTCTAQACTCPCPRPPRKAPSATNATGGGRVSMGPCQPSSNQDSSGHRRPCQAPLQGPGQGQGRRPSPDPTGAVCQESNAGTRGPRILHCYDDQNPDAYLTLKISGLQPSHYGGPIDVNVVNNCSGNTRPMVENAAQGQPVTGTGRTTQGQGGAPPPTPCDFTKVKQLNIPECSIKTSQRPPCNKPTRTPSPQPGPRPDCEAVQQSQQQYKENQQVTFYPQQHPQNAQACQRNQGPMAGQVQPGFSGGQASGSNRPTSQSGQRPRPSFGQTPGSFGVNNNASCSANMANLLQGIKQKAEAHRVKCDQPGSRRPGMNDTSCQVVSQQPTTNVCPQPSGTGCPNCGHEYRIQNAPRPQVCPDAGAAAHYTSTHAAAHDKRVFLDQPCPQQQSPQTKANRVQGQCGDDEQGESESYSSENEGACPVNQNAGPSSGRQGAGLPAKIKEKLPDMETYAYRRITKKNVSAPEPNTFREPMYNSPRNTRPVCQQAGAHIQNASQAVQQQHWPGPSQCAGPTQGFGGIGPTPTTSKFSTGGKGRGQPQKSKGTGMQTCPSQRPGQRRPAQEQDSEDWDEPATGFITSGQFGGGVDPFFFGSESQLAAMGQTGAQKAQREERKRQGQNPVVNQNVNAWLQPGPSGFMPQAIPGQGNNSSRQYGGGVDPFFFGSESQLAAMGQTGAQKAQREERKRQGQNPAVNQNVNVWAQAGPSSCMQQAIQAEANSSRTQISQIRLSQQKSNSSTKKTITNNNGKSFGKSQPGPSKSETRSNIHAEKKSKSYRKSEPNSSKSEVKSYIDSETKSKIESKPKGPIKSETRVKNKFEHNTKVKSYPKVKNTYLSKDPMFQTKRKNQQATFVKSGPSCPIQPGPSCPIRPGPSYANQPGPSYANQPGPSYANQPGPSYANQGQGNDSQQCSTLDDLIPSYRGNPYIENSLIYHRRRPTMAKVSTPAEWFEGHESTMDLSTIPNSTCGDIHNSSTLPVNTGSEESMEFIPISNTQNTGTPFYYSQQSSGGSCRRRPGDQWQPHPNAVCSENDTQYLQGLVDETVYQTIAQDEQTDINEISEMRECGFY